MSASASCRCRTFRSAPVSTCPSPAAAPSVRFNFAERQNPFNLTVSLFGGGGFFAITIGSGGVQELEASLEFGAQISIDLGVASGGVYIKGGFYFCWMDSPTHLVQFEGYVELGGHLNILGLIVVSLVFHLGLTYQKAGHVSQLYGTALPDGGNRHPVLQHLAIRLGNEAVRRFGLRPQLPAVRTNSSALDGLLRRLRLIKAPPDAAIRIRFGVRETKTCLLSSRKRLSGRYAPRD